VTREQHRTKAMAMIGGSIGLMFAPPLVAAPVLVSLIGMRGCFALMRVLSLAGIWVTVSVVPPEPAAVNGMRLAAFARRPSGVLRIASSFGSTRHLFRFTSCRWPFSSLIPVALVRTAGSP